MQWPFLLGGRRAAAARQRVCHTVDRSTEGIDKQVTTYLGKDRVVATV